MRHHDLHQGEIRRVGSLESQRLRDIIRHIEERSCVDDGSDVAGVQVTVASACPVLTCVVGAGACQICGPSRGMSARFSGTFWLLEVGQVTWRSPLALR